MSASWINAALIAAVVAVSTGCGGHSAGPNRTLNEYSRALERRDYDRAYKLMSDEYRSRNSKEDFKRMLVDNPREVSETASRLRSARGDLEVTAELRYGLGDRLQLVREGGEWRIAANPVDFYGQSTPREALRSFLRAYSLKRWDVLLRFVPENYRKRMTVETIKTQFEGEAREDIARTMAMIAANVDEPINEQGSDARLRYGEAEVVFIREERAWKIKDLD
jgi:hypothetical protein